MAEGVVAGTYGHALFELAVEQNEIDRLVTEAGTVKEIFAANPDFQKLLTHPRVSADRKQIIIEECFRGRVSDDMTGFLAILVKNGREKNICDSLTDFETEVREYRGIGTCIVTSALPLTEEQKERLRVKLTEVTKYRSFETEYRVDKSLIGGMTVRIGDRVLDATIRSQLNDLQKTLRHGAPASE